MDIKFVAEAVKEALEISRSTKGLNNSSQLSTAMSDISDKLTTAQSDLLDFVLEHYQLLEENRDLKIRLCNRDTFTQYRLETVAAGDYILSLKDEHISDEQPAHAICIKCRSEDRLSVMTEDEFWYQCPSCDHLVML